MLGIDSIVTSVGDVRPHVRPVVAEIAQRFGPLYFVWGAPGRGTGDHARGLALDFMGYELGGGVNNPGRMRFQLCQDIAGYVLANRRRLNVAYVIWNRRIASAESSPAWSWRTYHGDNPHTDHVHVSFEEAGTYRSPTPVKEDEDVTPADIEKVAQRAAELVWAKRLTDGNPATETDPEARSWLVGGMSKWDRQREEMKTVMDLLASIDKRLEEMES